MTKLTKIKQKDINNLKGRTNWSQLKNQTEGEINNAALSDPDAKLLTDYELMRMKKPKQ